MSLFRVIFHFIVEEKKLSVQGKKIQKYVLRIVRDRKEIYSETYAETSAWCAQWTTIRMKNDELLTVGWVFNFSSPRLDIFLSLFFSSPHPLTSSAITQWVLLFSDVQNEGSAGGCMWRNKNSKHVPCFYFVLSKHLTLFLDQTSLSSQFSWTHFCAVVFKNLTFNIRTWRLWGICT